MIALVVVDNPRLGQAFVDYLATRRIEARLQSQEQGYAILVDSQADRDWLENELQRFLAEPLHPRYQAASWQVADSRRARFDYGPGHHGIVSAFMSHAGPVTLGMVLVCGALFVAARLGADRFIYEYLHFPFRLATEGRTQPWRLLTPILLHFSVLHVLFNLLWWWYLGGMIERNRGSGKLLLLLLVAGVLPNVGQYWLDGPNFGGLSGVVYGLIGYIWVVGSLRPERGLHLPGPYIAFMLLWMVFGFLQLFGPPMANMAHLLGLLVGCIQGGWDSRR